MLFSLSILNLIIFVLSYYQKISVSILVKLCFHKIVYYSQLKKKVIGYYELALLYNQTLERLELFLKIYFFIKFSVNIRILKIWFMKGIDH